MIFFSAYAYEFIETAKLAHKGELDAFYYEKNIISFEKGKQVIQLENYSTFEYDALLCIKRHTILLTTERIAEPNSVWFEMSDIVRLDPGDQKRAIKIVNMYLKQH
ncbi:hypothetical protein UM181_00945 [Alphaproteobacteria bacterium US3C007]|nr:hypothetical protein UM181_00945 [Alphaproteobacteria bacterium US3C007]